MIKSEGYEDRPEVTAKQRAAQIIHNIISQAHAMPIDELLAGGEPDTLTQSESEEIERHVHEMGQRLLKVIEKPIAAVTAKDPDYS